MSRPGRFALRVLAITAVLFVLIAPPSFGQAVSLTGETFETVPALGQQTTFGAFTCNKNGTTVIPFQTEGDALGPYLGSFTETGTITIGPQTDTTFDSRGTGVILDFQASFTITSTVPTGTVTGTKQLAPTQPPPETHSAVGRCDPNGSSPPATDVFALVSDPFVLYSAQINAVTGTRTDSGTSGFVIQNNPLAPATFQEAFTSTAPPPPPVCEDDDDGHGHGHGHWRGGDDDDDDDEEDCD